MRSAGPVCLESAGVTTHLGHMADVMRPAALMCNGRPEPSVALTRLASQSPQLFGSSVENGLNCFMCRRFDRPEARAERRIQAGVRRSDIPRHQLMRDDEAVCMMVLVVVGGA